MLKRIKEALLRAVTAVGRTLGKVLGLGGKSLSYVGSKVRTLPQLVGLKTPVMVSDWVVGLVGTIVGAAIFIPTLVIGAVYVYGRELREEGLTQWRRARAKTAVKQRWDEANVPQYRRTVKNLNSDVDALLKEKALVKEEKAREKALIKKHRAEEKAEAKAAKAAEKERRRADKLADKIPVPPVPSEAAA
jgi:signal transduction histidine kinase